MKKSIVIACVVVLLIGLVAAGAQATATNWVVAIKAYSEAWTGVDKSPTVGIGTASQTLASGSAAVNKAEVLATDGTSVWTKKILAGTTTSGTFGLKIGEGGGFASLNINIYNIATGTGGVNTALDTSLVYTFKNGATTIATFSSAANHALEVAAGRAVTGWNDVALLMKPTGWANGLADRGWFYTDTTPTINSSFLALEDYSFSFDQFVTPEPPVTPEPGSLLALGSGLIGMAGYAIRRRRA